MICHALKLRVWLFLCLLIGAPRMACAQDVFLLNDFNNQGMQLLTDGFGQQLGAFAARLFDNTDGFGVASSTLGGVDLAGLQNGGSLNVRYNPLEGHGTDYFAVELVDNQSGVLRYQVDTTVPTQPGQFGFYDTSYDLATPSGGSVAFNDFNFSNVNSWRVVGQQGSPGPFNVNLFNIELEGDLPDPPVNYGGLDPNSPWRAEAEQRIDQVRKADLSLRVVDQAGTPIPGATVSVNQTRQAFQFGTAVAVDNILGGGSNNQIYRDRLLELFNTVTIENGLKWDPLSGQWGPGWSLAESVQALDWLQQNGLHSRGHVLIWPGSQNMPDYLDPLIAAAQSGDPQAQQDLKDEIHDHILEVVAATDGKVVDWDVVNEIGTNNNVLNIYGEQVMDEWFAAARQTDPDAKLFINEFNIISDQQRSKRQSYLNQILGLVNRGAEIDGIGFQAHFQGENQLTDLDATGGSDPQTVWDILDQFHGQTGLPITITEYDLETTNETLKANYLRDFLTATFAHEGVNGFIMWGFWEGRHWRPDAAMFNQDWSETPSVQVWRDLVLGEWMTDEAFASTLDAELLRAFKGEYEVTVEYNGETYTFEFSLGSGGLTTDLVLPFVSATPGDYNADGVVDAADYTAWRDTLGQAVSPGAGADGDGNGVIDQPDYLLWRNNFGLTTAQAVPAGAATPEPSALLLGGAAVCVWLAAKRRRLRQHSGRATLLTQV